MLKCSRSRSSGCRCCCCCAERRRRRRSKFKSKKTSRSDGKSRVQVTRPTCLPRLCHAPASWQANMRSSTSTCTKARGEGANVMSVYSSKRKEGVNDDGGRSIYHDIDARADDCLVHYREIQRVVARPLFKAADLPCLLLPIEWKLPCCASPRQEPYVSRGPFTWMARVSDPSLRPDHVADDAMCWWRK